MKQQLRFFFDQSRGYRLGLLWSLTLGLLNIICGLIFIYISKSIVDVATGRVEGNMWQYVGYLALMLLLRLGVSGLRQWVSGRVHQRLFNAMRERLFQSVLNSPWHGREDFKSGDIMSRIGEDLRVVVNCIDSDMPAIILSLFQLLAASCFLFAMMPNLLYALLLILPIALVLSKLYYKTMRKLTKQIRVEESEVVSHIQESVQNRSLLLSLRRTDLMNERLQQRHSHLFQTFSRRLGFSIRTRLFVQSGFSVGYYTAFVWSAYGLLTGTVTYGMMTALLQLVGQVQGPILELSTLFPAIVQACTAAERLQELNPDNPNDSSQPTAQSAVIPVLPQEGAPFGLRLSHISYRYPDGTEDVLHDFSCLFAPSSSTAIIGPTGSGKSTLVRLLLGLIEPTQGNIELIASDGTPVRLPQTPNDQHAGRGGALCYVPQGNSLLSGTIRDNLLLGKLDATEDELHDALRRASALFVYDLPQGIDSPCGEKGSGLSEGQAQRIAIARALLQPGSIMILDEASSALDPDTEQQILSDLQQHQLGKTLIWVTHHMVVRDYMQHCLEVE